MFRTTSLLMLVLFLISCGTKKKLIKINKNGDTYISAYSFGATGDGKKDDRASIQSALDSEQNIYFSKGIYLLKSKTDVQGILNIDSKSMGKIYCEKGAIWKVSKSILKDYVKPAVLRIYSGTSNINLVVINGLTIDGNKDNHDLKNTGILLYEKTGSRIKKVYLSDITIKNCGGSGIQTTAEYNQFKRIKTENNGMHGIGVVNWKNKGEKEFYLNDLISVNDGGYSIDFSGPTDGKTLINGYEWKGFVKNVKSINCKYGLKTAGYWALSLENVEVKNCTQNGFFVNIDAPGSVIKIKNMRIFNAQNTGVYLAAKSHVIANNLEIIGCKKGLIIERATVDIENLIIDGQQKNINSLRIGNDAKIKNFTIKNAAKRDEFPIWIKGNKVKLENGILQQNLSPYEIIVHESAKNVDLINLKIIPPTEKSAENKVAIMNIQKQGRTNIVGGDYSKVKGVKIIDKANKVKVSKAKGILNRY